jgi:hypothetical protein
MKPQIESFYFVFLAFMMCYFILAALNDKYKPMYGH